MTNLDRLKGSPLLFDGLVAFVDRWAGELKASGEFDDVEPVSREYPDLPEPLRQFYELRDRWPFLKLGDPQNVFAEPKIQESGLIVFCELSSGHQLSVQKKGDEWEFWSAHKDGDVILPDRELEYPLDQALVEVVLSAMSWYPWGVEPGNNGILDRTGDDFPLVRQLLDERSLIYCEEGGYNWAFYRGTEAYFWHPAGVLIRGKTNGISPYGDDQEGLEPFFSVSIGTCNLEIRNRLLVDGCRPRSTPRSGPVFTVGRGRKLP